VALFSDMHQHMHTVRCNSYTSLNLLQVSALRCHGSYKYKGAQALTHRFCW